jgi:hypothetical protein
MFLKLKWREHFNALVPKFHLKTDSTENEQNFFFKFHLSYVFPSKYRGKKFQKATPESTITIQI